jgi:hypothetical protein
MFFFDFLLIGTISIRIIQQSDAEGNHPKVGGCFFPSSTKPLQRRGLPPKLCGWPENIHFLSPFSQFED